MKETLTKKYGLFTAIAMVVGIVIGSGVFFKAEDVLKQLDGNMPLGILAWLIGGLVIVSCAITFATMATKYEHVGGPVDYAEATCGKTYAYMLSWFLAVVYYPAVAAVLAWVSARYVGEIFGFGATSAEVMTLAGFFLLVSYCINSLAPKLAGKLQVSVTVIKMIPLILMAVIGTIVGLFNGNIGDALATGATNSTVGGDAIFGAVVSTAFAYDGWIIATSINAEIKDAKKNLPLALLFGCLIIVLTYVLYYIGLCGAADVGTLTQSGGVFVAFSNVFGKGFATVLKVFIAVSCLGTLNGLALANARGFYACADRENTKPFQMFKNLDPSSNIPTNTSILGLLFTAFWFLYFYGANLTGGWFGVFNFDSSELPIITIYTMYIPIFINFMRKEKEMGPFRRFVLPGMSIVGSVFMIVATVYSHGIKPFLKAQTEGKFSFPVLFYLIVFAVIMFAGWLMRYIGRKMEKRECGKTQENNGESETLTQEAQE